MDERKTFLDTLQTTIRKLQEEGIITQKELKEKIEIPIEWLYSKGISRDVVVTTMNNLCIMRNPAYKRNLKNNININYIRICERNEKIILEVPGVDGWTYFCLADDISYHKNRKVTYFSSEEFVQEVYKTMSDKENEQFRQDIDKLSPEELQLRMKAIFGAEKKQEKLGEISKSLSEMMENLGHYYEKIYERKKILMDLNPEQIVLYDLPKENGKSEKYTGYAFKNYRENGGYFLIIESEDQNKAIRARYFTDEMKQRLQAEIEDEQRFWRMLTQIHSEMADRDFKKQKRVQLFDDTKLDIYAAKITYVISGKVDTTVPRHIINSAKLSLTKMFGNNVDLEQITRSVPEEDIKQARQQIMPRSPEKDVGGIEK